MDPVDLICLRCKHFLPIGGGCKAFDEIPVETIVEKGHSKVLPDQKGDFIFEHK